MKDVISPSPAEKINASFASVSSKGNSSLFFSRDSAVNVKRKTAMKTVILFEQFDCTYYAPGDKFSRRKSIMFFRTIPLRSSPQILSIERTILG